MSHQCSKCQGVVPAGAEQCSVCGMTFDQPTADEVVPDNTAQRIQVSRLEHFAQVWKRRREISSAKPTRMSRWDEFHKAWRGPPYDRDLQHPEVIVAPRQQITTGNGRVVAGFAVAIAVAAMVLIGLLNFGIGGPTRQADAAAVTTDVQDAAPPVSPAPAQATSPDPAPAASAAPAASQPCNPLAPPDPKFGGCAPGTAPVQQAAAPVPVPQAAPVQQAAPPQPTYAPPPTQQAAYAPPVAQPPTSPPFDPTPGYQQAANDVNACYADGIKQYNQALYRLHNLNGAGMQMNKVSMDLYWQGILRDKDQCSPDDQPKADALADDLVQKSELIDSAGKSSPTGGN